MSPSDFVYNQVYKGALNKGANPMFAQQRAVIAVESFKKNSFKGKVGAYIEQEIKEAVKLSKRV